MNFLDDRAPEHRHGQHLESSNDADRSNRVRRLALALSSSFTRPVCSGDSSHQHNSGRPFASVDEYVKLTSAFQDGIRRLRREHYCLLALIDRGPSVIGHEWHAWSPVRVGTAATSKVGEAAS